MNNPSSRSHRSVQPSTTLNRKYVKRPANSATPTPISPKTAALNSAAKIQAERLKERQARAEQINREQLAKLKKNHTPITKKTTITQKPSTKSPSSKSAQKDHAIESALKSTSNLEKHAKKTPKMKNHSFFSLKRVLLALGCSIIAVAAIAYCVNMSMPDISLGITALQNDIDASTPSYIPRGYDIDNVVTETGKVSFTYRSGDKTFVLTEENSTWDSATLETNYVKTKFDDYSPIREQGLTLFISGSNCVWVNGGKLYTIEGNNSELTKKQIQSIATSF